MLRPEGRTPAEVTAAAERTADITLRLVRVTRERDEALAAVERVRALAEEWNALIDWHYYGDAVLAALGERP